jgi:hypothetical protein
MSLVSATKRRRRKTSALPKDGCQPALRAEAGFERNVSQGAGRFNQQLLGALEPAAFDECARSGSGRLPERTGEMIRAERSPGRQVVQVNRSMEIRFDKQLDSTQRGRRQAATQMRAAGRRRWEFEPGSKMRRQVFLDFRRLAKEADEELKIARGVRIQHAIAIVSQRRPDALNPLARMLGHLDAGAAAGSVSRVAGELQSIERRDDRPLRYMKGRRDLGGGSRSPKQQACHTRKIAAVQGQDPRREIVKCNGCVLDSGDHAADRCLQKLPLSRATPPGSFHAASSFQSCLVLARRGLDPTARSSKTGQESERSILASSGILHIC